MNVNITNNIEEQINNEFIKQIEELPEEIKDPLENTLKYIKKRAVCNDYEAAQINALMAEQSDQKKGYNYYCKYIAGQSTPEEDKADYYISIRKSWDRFLNKYANMSMDERTDALITTSVSMDEINRILEGSDQAKLDFIYGRVDPLLDIIDDEAGKLTAKNLLKNIFKPKKILDDCKNMENSIDKYFYEFQKSDKIYDMSNNLEKKEPVVISSDITDNSYDMDAYASALKGCDELKKIAGREHYTIKNGYTKEDGKHHLILGDIIQCKIPVDDESDGRLDPIYKYVHLKNKNVNGEYELSELDLKALKRDGTLAGKDNDIHHIRFQQAQRNRPSNKFTNKANPYLIETKIMRELTVRDLTTLYNLDLSGIGERLKKIKPLPSANDYGENIGNLCVACMLFIAGCAAIGYALIVGFKEFITGAIGAAVVGGAVGMILGALPVIIASGVGVSRIKEAKDDHKDQMKEVYNLIEKHNTYPTNYTPKEDEIVLKLQENKTV